MNTDLYLIKIWYHLPDGVLTNYAEYTRVKQDAYLDEESIAITEKMFADWPSNPPMVESVSFQKMDEENDRNHFQA